MPTPFPMQREWHGFALLTLYYTQQRAEEKIPGENVRQDIYTPGVFVVGFSSGPVRSQYLRGPSVFLTFFLSKDAPFEHIGGIVQSNREGCLSLSAAARPRENG